MLLLVLVALFAQDHATDLGARLAEAGGVNLLAAEPICSTAHWGSAGGAQPRLATKSLLIKVCKLTIHQNLLSAHLSLIGDCPVPITPLRVAQAAL